MRRSANTPSPYSLDLLLDTMCNTFGGIILIALLVALTSLSRPQTPDQLTQAQKTLEESRLQTLKQQLQEAQTLQSQLNSQESSPETQEQLRKIQALLALQEQITRHSNILHQLQAQQLALPSLEAQIQQTQAQAQSLSQQLTESQTQSRTLQRQIESLTTNQTQRVLRLPNEHQIQAPPFYFIVRFGQIFPLHEFGQNQLNRNFRTIHWAGNAEQQIPSPMKGKGFSLPKDQAVLLDYFKHLQLQGYQAFFLAYNDSFPLFIQAKELSLKEGLNSGWTFLTPQSPISFSAGGQKPPAL